MMQSCVFSAKKKMWSTRHHLESSSYDDVTNLCICTEDVIGMRNPWFEVAGGKCF